MKGQKTKISECPVEMRPRERLLCDSAKSLSNYELLAILLQTGTAECDVLELAKEVLVQCNGLEGMLHTNKEALCAIRGIGQGKACTLLAAVEISRRLMETKVSYTRPKITSPDIAESVFRHAMSNSQQETFHVAYLDTKHMVIDNKEIFVGTLNASMVHMRDIFREAVQLNAHAIIVGHNHPSGDITPSSADCAVTKRIQETGALLEIPLLDHIIIGKIHTNNFLSMKEEGYMSKIM